MMKRTTTLTGWGNFPASTAFVSRPEKIHQLTLNGSPSIARGLGRSYGDASLNSEHNVILMERLNRFLAFDEKKGIVRAEAGVTFDDLLKTFVPRGWFPPVTPGTKFVSLGGSIAVDVHGKNHHTDGTIGNFVKEMQLLTPDGSLQQCSPQNKSDLFWASVGGMGLTGIITETTLQMIPIETTSITVKHQHGTDLDSVLQLLSSPENNDKYSVAWIDCLATGKEFGKGIVMTGHHTKFRDLPISNENPLKIAKEKIISIPFHMPGWILNSWSLKLFNQLYYKMQKKGNQPFQVDFQRFFYPLDSIHNWNRLYGKSGFVQYQFVLPAKTSHQGLKAILNEFVAKKCGSFLAVLKKFGAEGPGLLSFPREGYTLALDIPIKDASLFSFLDQIDEMVLRYEGRVYLAKDARMKPEIFKAMYPRYPKWQQIKAQIDPKGIFSSDLSRRLHLEGKR